jgi:hypothetical protein
LVSLVVGHTTGSDDAKLDCHERMSKTSPSQVKRKMLCDCRIVRQGDAAKSSAGVASRSLGSSTGSNVPPAVGGSRGDAEARRRRKKEVSVSREDAKTRRKGRKRGSSLTRRRGGAEGLG